jgi:quercetin dioxygenase-like cupin family protein
MPIIDNRKLERATLPGIEHVTLAGNSDGLSSLSVWKQCIAPNTATPPHRHDCEEVVMCESGRGELHIEGRVEAFGAEMTVVIPRNVPHQILNVGDEPMHLTAVLAASPVEVSFPDGSALALPWRT